MFGIFVFKMLIFLIYKKSIIFFDMFKVIFGYLFCMGVKKVFLLILENVLRVVVINFIGDFVLFFGKFSIMVVVFVVGNEFF